MSSVEKLLRSVYGDDVQIRTWTKEEIRAYEQRMKKALKVDKKKIAR